MGTILKYLDNGEWKPFLGDVPAPSNSIVSNNTPTGDIDGTNTVFTTGQPYIPGSLEVYVNGLLQVSGIHYTETDPSTGEFTFSEAPLAGDNIVCNYMVANTATGNADTVDSFHASATPTPNTLLPLDANGEIPSPLADIKIGLISSSTLGTVGSKAITGLGFKPRLVKFTVLYTDGVSSSRNAPMAIGAMDRSGNQFAYCAVTRNSHGGSTRSSQSLCFHLYTVAAGGGSDSLNCAAEFESMDSDGFTINVTNATVAYDVIYEAYA